jgi:hypothetical protein
MGSGPRRRLHERLVQGLAEGRLMVEQVAEQVRGMRPFVL